MKRNLSGAGVVAYILLFVLSVVIGLAIGLGGCASRTVVYGGEGTGSGVKVYVPRRDGNDVHRPKTWLSGRRVVLEARSSFGLYSFSGREMTTKIGHQLRQFGVVIVEGEGDFRYAPESSGRGEQKYDRILISSADDGRNKVVILEYYLLSTGESPISAEGRGYDLSRGTWWGYKSSTMSSRDWRETAWNYAIRAAVEALAYSSVKVEYAR